MALRRGNHEISIHSQLLELLTKFIRDCYCETCHTADVICLRSGLERRRVGVPGGWNVRNGFEGTLCQRMCASFNAFVREFLILNFTDLGQRYPLSLADPHGLLFKLSYWRSSLVTLPPISGSHSTR